MSSEPQWCKQTCNFQYASVCGSSFLQVIVCSREIGWRNESRKMIVVSTDSDFHIAGDGFLGGIIEPNDELCHLDADGELPVHIATNTDYPSVSQMANKIAENKVNVIFAIPQRRTTVVASYALLAEHMEGTTIGNLTADCSNVVKLIGDNCNKTSRTVQLKVKTHNDDEDHVSMEDDIRVSVWSKCLGTEEREMIRPYRNYG